MKVIAEFVDIRTGARYFPGDGDRIFPPLDEEQIARLLAAGCLKEGVETASLTPPPPSPDPDGDDLERRTVAELQALAAERGVSLEGVSRKADIIAAIQAARG